MEETGKKTAREILETYDGPKLRIMEVWEHIPMKFSVWVSVRFFPIRSN